MASSGLQRRMAEAFVNGARNSPEEIRKLAMKPTPLRGLLVGQIFQGMAREFDSERGGDIDAVVRWEVGGEGKKPDVWELVIRGGRCSAVRDSGEQPRTVVGLDHQTLLELAVGLANAPQAYITGRLRMKGDVALAQRMTSLFLVPGNRTGS